MFLFLIFTSGIANIFKTRHSDKAQRYPRSDNGYIKTSQSLPEECTSWIEDFYCPERHENALELNEEWTRLNNVCCSIHPKTVLHCQRIQSPSGDTINFPACLEDIEVAAGVISLLFVSNQGNPDHKLEICDNDHFENLVKQFFHCVSLLHQD